MAYNKTPVNEAPELIEKVVYLNRVSKTVKGGRVMKFSALVVVGDGKGTVGTVWARLPRFPRPSSKASLMLRRIWSRFPWMALPSPTKSWASSVQAPFC